MASSSMARESAGLLMFRRVADEIEVFLAHPGGPFWAKKDLGAWTIPKGQPNGDEEPLATAIREFVEETSLSPKGPYIDLGSVRQKAGKVVRAWAFEGDADPASVRSNSMKVEWPRGSGKWLTFPEIDRCEWFTAQEGLLKINSAQAEFVNRLASHLGSAP